MTNQNQNPAPQADRVRIKKSQKFAVRNKELFDLHLRVFSNYCVNVMGYSKIELHYLKQIFKGTITPKNIRQYINVSAADIHHGIAHNCLSKYSNNQPID